MADLAQCGRCRAWTLLDKSGPVAVAIDLTPLDVLGYRDALMGGVSRYRVEKRQNGATRLSPVGLGGSVAFNPETGAQTAAEGLGPVHREHGCPASVQRVVKTAAPKGSAPATPGAPKDGSRPLAAHVYAARGPGTRSPATSVTSHLSSAYPVCGTCQRNIPNGRMFTGIQHGPIWIWAECEKCE